MRAMLEAAAAQWDAEQAPIRRDAAQLEAAIRAVDKEAMTAWAKKVIAHKEPWTLPLLASGLWKPSVIYRETVIRGMRTVDPEDGLWQLVNWLEKEPMSANGVLAWEEIRLAADPRTLPAIKKGILDNLVQAEIRIRALGEIKDRSNIPFLIDVGFKVDPKAARSPQLEPACQKLTGITAAALESLTAQKLGTDMRAWRDWWKKAEKDFELPR